MSRLTPLLRWRYPLLIVTAFVFSLQHMRGTGEDWRYFVLGSELLFGVHHRSSPLAGGLHLYANYPDVQIGPLSLVLATPFRLLGRSDGRVAAALLCTAIAPSLVFTLERAAAAVWRDADRRLVQLTVFLGGLVVVQAWSPLATIYAHLDDVLVLAALVVALWAVAIRRPWLVGTALGTGMALKPWAVVALALVLAVPRRDWWRAAAAAGVIAAMAWLPFIVADPATMGAFRPQVLTAPESVLALLGVRLGDAPVWVRPVQLVSGLAAGAIAVARGRWGAVLLVGISLRVALDPQAFLYYSAGLVIAALAWDLLRSPRPLPVWTLGAFVLLDVSYVAVESPGTRSVLRLIITFAAVTGAIIAPASTPARSQVSKRGSPDAQEGPAEVGPSCCDLER